MKSPSLTLSAAPSAPVIRVDRLVSNIRGLTAVSIQNIAALDYLRRRGIASIAIVGSSGSGKSTIVQAIRVSAAVRDGLLSVPLRITTRPVRLNENVAENKFVPAPVFKTMAANGEFSLRWARIMDNGREELYAFANISVSQVPVYAANNALFANSDSIWPIDFNSATLYVGIYAPDAVRERRLLKRSPDLKLNRPAEFDHRVADLSTNMLPHIHIRVDNYDEMERIAPTEIVRLIEDSL